MTQITNFRTSFIWVETIPAILAQQLNTSAPCAFLGYRGRYAQEFDKLKRRKGALSELELPWPRPQGHHYWKHYFAGRHAGDVIGDDAWQRHVPLRGRLPFHISARERNPRVTFEIFYSSQGTALVANVYYRGDFVSLEEVATLAHAVRNRYQFRTDAGQARNGMSLQSVAEYALATARRAAFGDVEAFAGYNQPFSITTFVQGTVADPATPIVDGSVEHRMLEALTGWNQNFAIMNLSKTPLQSASLTIHSRLDSDLVYARGTGRAIWLPRLFSTNQDRGKLSCYHRNITLASLQTMSLGEFVGWVARRYERGESVPELVQERAKRATRLLGIFATGERTATYRSMSIATQINDAKWRPSMELIASRA
jgi:hypothetical protein